MLLRSNFNRSALVRQLAGWQAVPGDAPRQDLAERLGQWFNVNEAIALSSAHEALPTLARAHRPAVPASARALQAELQRVRATLTKAITCAPQKPGDEGAAGDDDLPGADTHSVDTTNARFAPHRQRCLEQQRRMELAIEALRGHARKTLSLTSTRLAQLAALDAVLEPLLGGREQRLLATVPASLKTRFAQLRLSHPGGWQVLFEEELQQALLAELDLRLQPVTGMVEALSQEVTQAP